MKTHTENETATATGTESESKKIIVIGGTGLIGKQVVASLRAQGHQAIAASPSTGINALTGEGLAEALTGADTIVDVSNSPSFEDGPVMNFFETSARNLAQAAKAAGVKHLLILSVVGADRLPESGYMRAKVVQEDILRASGIPFTILRATQFFEFTAAIAYTMSAGDSVRAPGSLYQPMAAADVATAVVQAALSQPANRLLEIGGPAKIPMVTALREYLKAMGDPRPVVEDASATYFGLAIDDTSLTTGQEAAIGKTTFDQWLQQQTVAAVTAQAA